MKKFGMLLILSMVLIANSTAQVNELKLSIDDYQDLLWEEKVAHDIYQSFYNKYGVQAFGNIMQSEERHFAMMKEMVDRKMESESEMSLGKVGVFANQDFQDLYDELYKRGMTSKKEALLVGALIEEMDIADLKNGLSLETDEEASALFTKLIAASENHLRAFVKNLDKTGVKYEPVILGNADYQKIISAQNSCCSSKGESQGCSGNKAKGKKGKAKKGCCSSSS